jgi:hypothetical protein
MARFRWGLERDPDPRFHLDDDPFGIACLIVFIIVLALLGGLVPLSGAEPEATPLLYIYSAKWCQHCRDQDRDFERTDLDSPPFHVFRGRIVKLDPPANTIAPCIYWRGEKDGKWHRFVGWGKGDDIRFWRAWMKTRDIKTK